MSLVSDDERERMEEDERKRQQLIEAIERGDEVQVRALAVSAGAERLKQKHPVGPARVTTIVRGSFDETLRVWDLESMEEKACLEGHNHWVTSVAISRDGKTAVSGSWDETLRVWDLGSMTQKACLEGDGA